jgi:hypothetical protein
MSMMHHCPSEDHHRGKSYALFFLELWTLSFGWKLCIYTPSLFLLLVSNNQLIHVVVDLCWVVQIMLSQVLQRRLSFWYFHFHSEMLANLQQFFKLQEDCQWLPRSCFCVKCIEGERQEWHSLMMYILFWKCISTHSKTIHNTLAICIIWLDMCWCLRMRFLFTHWLSQQ